jgi:purine-cytosine permease-like protein
VSEAVGEVAAAVAETVTQAVEAIANLGKDLSPVEKQQAAPVAIAIVISQVATAAVAAASNAASAAAASAARKATK